MSRPASRAALELLTGPEAQGLLGAALATAGLELHTWRADAVDVREERVTVCWVAVVSEGVDGPQREQWLGGSVPPPDGDVPGLVRLGDGETTAGVWCWPVDPALPALPTATDAGAVQALLASYGAPAEPVALEVVTYRPGRRAVVRATAASSAVYLKVGRPSRVAALHRRHDLLRQAGFPAPRSLGWSEQGLLVLTALPGTPLRDVLLSGGPVPDAEQVLALLDRLPAQLLDLPARPGWADSAAHYAEAVADVLPAVADRARSLAARIQERLAVADRAPQPVHGDFYEAQLLLQGDRITGVLDVDTAGPGRRADDLGCALGHLDVLADLWAGEPAGARCRALLQDWTPAFADAVEPDELWARTAGVVLSLATGPHRVQDTRWPQATERRLALAEAWLQRCPAAASA